MVLSLLGSANLVRSGLRPNGPSDSASRHRLRRPQRHGPAPIAKSREVTIHLHEEGRGSELVRIISRQYAHWEKRTSRRAWGGGEKVAVSASRQCLIPAIGTGQRDPAIEQVTQMFLRQHRFFLSVLKDLPFL